MSAEIEVPVVLPTASVRKALCLAQRDVGGIGKDSQAKIVGKNKDGGRVEYSYQFTSTEDMLEHCRHALHEHGLSWEMTGWDVVGALPGFNVPTLVGTFELCHGDSGEVLTRVYKMPIASRNDADKATAGAITYLLGQATRALLMVPKVSDTDAKNDPDKRTSEHGGWRDRDEPRSQRVVTPAVTPQAQRGHSQAPASGSMSGDMSEKQIDAAISKVFKEIRGIVPEITAGVLREEAAVPPTGTLTIDQKKIVLRSMEQRLKSMRAAMESDPPPPDEDA